MKGYSDERRNTINAKGVVNMAVHTIFAYFFYQYAFNNPDQGSCWAISSSQIPSAVKLPGYRNVNSQFNCWFTWGFWISVAGMASSLVETINFKESDAAVKFE